MFKAITNLLPDNILKGMGKYNLRRKINVKHPFICTVLKSYCILYVEYTCGKDWVKKMKQNPSMTV